VQRTVPLTQDSVWAPYSAFKAKTMEGQLDKLVMQDQQLARDTADLTATVSGLSGGTGGGTTVTAVDTLLAANGGYQAKVYVVQSAVTLTSTEPVTIGSWDFTGDATVTCELLGVSAGGAAPQVCAFSTKHARGLLSQFTGTTMAYTDLVASSSEGGSACTSISSSNGVSPARIALSASDGTVTIKARASGDGGNPFLAAGSYCIVVNVLSD
jgi:hypothetical protein